MSGEFVQLTAHFAFWQCAYLSHRPISTRHIIRGDIKLVGGDIKFITRKN
jgi:hypothetical protein